MKLPLEDFWAEILSRDAVRIMRIWRDLTLEEKEAVRSHLQRMVSEDGWTEPQRISATAAIKAISTWTEER